LPEQPLYGVIAVGNKGTRGQLATCSLRQAEATCGCGRAPRSSPTTSSMPARPPSVGNGESPCTPSVNCDQGPHTRIREKAGA
jgi:hypothetical protein